MLGQGKKNWPVHRKQPFDRKQDKIQGPLHVTGGDVGYHQLMFDVFL